MHMHWGVECMKLFGLRAGEEAAGAGAEAARAGHAGALRARPRHGRGRLPPAAQEEAMTNP